MTAFPTCRGKVFIDFSSRFGYYMKYRLPPCPARAGAIKFQEVSVMKKGTKLTLLVGIITAIAAVAASVTALLMYLDHKKDEEELEHYLDCSIQ